MADLITTQDVADSLGSSYSGRADVAALIAAASGLVEDHCNRVFAEAALDEVLDGTGTDCVLVARPPIASVSSVEVDGDELDNSGGTAYVVETDGRAIYRGAGTLDPRFACRWPKGRRNVRVQYTGGFSTVPSPVKLATVLLVQHIADRLDHSQSLISEQIGDYQYAQSVSLLQANELPGVVAALLSPYRLRTVR